MDRRENMEDNAKLEEGKWMIVLVTGLSCTM